MCIILPVGTASISCSKELNIVTLLTDNEVVLVDDIDVLATVVEPDEQEMCLVINDLSRAAFDDSWNNGIVGIIAGEEMLSVKSTGRLMTCTCVLTKIWTHH